MKKTLGTMYWIGTFLKKILGTIYWGTCLFVIILPPSIKDVCLWQGIVWTCLAGGWVIITLPKAVRQYKELKQELKQVVSLYQDEAIDNKSRQEALDNGLVREVWDKFFDCLISAVLLGMSVGLTVIGIAIICVKYF
jgi:hypothetical protein